jgi:hypothetical protein
MTLDDGEKISYVLSNKMFDGVSLYKPDKLIRLSDIGDFSEIYQIMRDMDALNYAYAFCYDSKDETRLHYMKIGRSTPLPERVSQSCFGERIVRQVCHLNGWEKSPISSNGSDFRGGLERIMKSDNYPDRILNKNNWSIAIWNIHPNFRNCLVNSTREEQTIWLEAQLCKMYKRDFKENLPPLNIQDPSRGKIMNASWVSVSPTNTLFEFS